MSELKRPRRRFCISVAIGADTMQELMDSLEEIRQVIGCQGSKKGQLGGNSRGYIFEVVEDPSMTPEKYREQIKQYLAAMKQQTQPIAAAVAKQQELFEGAAGGSKPGHAQ